VLAVFVVIFYLYCRSPAFRPLRAEWPRPRGKVRLYLVFTGIAVLGNYLGIPVLGYIEPLPGIPPTASHLRDLVARLTGKKGVILYNSFHPSEGPAFLSRQLGWKSRQLQLEVPLDATGATYLNHIDQWVQAITGAMP
jgi:hypothetical protein